MEFRITIYAIKAIKGIKVIEDQESGDPNKNGAFRPR